MTRQERPEGRPHSTLAGQDDRTATHGLRTTPHRVGQASLLDPPDLPVVALEWPDETRVPSGLPVRERDPETSVAAAKRTREHKSRLRGDILIEHQLHPSGLTDDELVQTLEGQDRGVVARRRLDLVREGLLEDSGQRRPTRTGSAAIVWRLR